MKVGDKIVIDYDIKYLIGVNKTVKDIEGEPKTSSFEKTELYIKKIKGELVYFDEDYVKKDWYVTIKSELKTKMDKNIIGYKLIKATPDAKVGTKVGLDGKYTPTISYGKDYETEVLFPVKTLSNTEFFEPIYRSNFKVGDYIVILKGKTNWTESMNKCVGKTVIITEVYGKVVSFKEDGGWVWDYNDGHFRLASEEEIKQAKEGTYILKNIGSREVTLKFTKDSDFIEIVEKGDEISYSKLLSAFGYFNNIYSIGSYNIKIPFSEDRIFLIGCEKEDNKASLQEIKKVLEKWEETNG